MHPSTPALADRVRSATALTAKLELMANAYGGETCVIVTCGPSLKEFPVERLRAALGGVLTIVVKQGIDVVGEQADFHCWNSFNVTRFLQPSPATIRCFVTEPTGRIIQHNRYDLRFAAVSAEGDLSRSLAASHAFDDYLLPARLERPFGPGIMYELCFYLALHLGVSEIITIGWDIANVDGRNTHFYDRPTDQQFYESSRSAEPQHSARDRIPEVVKSKVRWAKTRRAHQQGAVYNRTRMLPGETELTAASTGPLSAWLQSRGVRLTVTSESPFLAEGIPRMSRDECLDRLERRAAGAE